MNAIALEEQEKTTNVEVSSVSKVFGKAGEVRALDGVDLSIPSGSLVVLLGPSGCGKTTLLRILAGLEDASSGSVTVSDKAVVDVAAGTFIPPDKRDIGMVFQNYALWPHMTVLENVSYPLRSQRVPKADAQKRAKEVLALLNCVHLTDRIPSQLSGGQQQRIALARALSASPPVVLFDEPLSNLDAQLRKIVRGEIRRMHREVGFTGVYVTHDLEEALELADEIVVMGNGKVEQSGSPRDVYLNPSSPYVAEFMGIDNKLEGRVDLDGSLQVADSKMKLPLRFTDSISAGTYSVYVRKEDIQLVHNDDSSLIRCDQAIVTDTVYSGEFTVLLLSYAGATLSARVHSDHLGKTGIGDRVDLGFDISHVLLYKRGEDGS